MSNSFGFGGNNAVLIFSTSQTPPRTRIAKPGRVAVTGVGVIGPDTASTWDIAPPLPPGQVSVRACGPLADAEMLSPNQRRRLSRIVQMSLVAARRSHAPDPSQRLAVAVGTGMGCLEDASIFLENLIGKDEREPMPTRFPGAVHNAIASQISIDLGARGLNSAPTAGEISFECALWQGMQQLAIDEADCALVGAVDELNKYTLSIGKRWGQWTEKVLPGEGVVIARLVPEEKTTTPLAHVAAVRLGRYRRPFNAEHEAEWIASTVDLANVDALLCGDKGSVALDPLYAAVGKALAARAGRTLDGHSYKDRCGEFHAASAFGFSVALDLVRRGSRGVLLYTLSLRGAKALCLVQP
jgi:hypothetical protein